MALAVGAASGVVEVASGEPSSSFVFVKENKKLFVILSLLLSALCAMSYVARYSMQDAC